MLVCLFICLFIGRVWHIAGWPRTHHVAKDDLVLLTLTSTSCVLGLRGLLLVCVVLGLEPRAFLVYARQSPYQPSHTPIHRGVFDPRRRCHCEGYLISSPTFASFLLPVHGVGIFLRHRHVGTRIPMAERERFTRG